MRARREATGPAAASRPGSVLRFVDLAALLRALVLAHLDPALALARVHAGARVARPGARPLPLARVDAGAFDLVVPGLVRRARDDRAAQEEPRRRRRDQHPLAA